VPLSAVPPPKVTVKPPPSQPADEAAISGLPTCVTAVSSTARESAVGDAMSSLRIMGLLGLSL